MIHQLERPQLVERLQRLGVTDYPWAQLILSGHTRLTCGDDVLVLKGSGLGQPAPVRTPGRSAQLVDTRIAHRCTGTSCRKMEAGQPCECGAPPLGSAPVRTVRVPAPNPDAPSADQRLAQLLSPFATRQPAAAPPGETADQRLARLLRPETEE
jgi:hypothetical protein